MRIESKDQSMINTADIQVLPQNLLSAIQKGLSTEHWLTGIGSLQIDELTEALKTDKEKYCFWINAYNAFYQHIRLTQSLEKPKIFSKKVCRIAGMQYSMDDIEHGILRRYRYKYSLGYFANPFAAGIIKELAVKTIDYRIHFALNCGANSCPPISIYKMDTIDARLDLATQEYLRQETKFDEQKYIVHVPRLLWWFPADFGGKKGIQKMYAEHLNRDIRAFKIQYKAFYWTSKLGNFK